MTRNISCEFLPSKTRQKGKSRLPDDPSNHLAPAASLMAVSFSYSSFTLSNRTSGRLAFVVALTVVSLIMVATPSSLYLYRARFSSLEPALDSLLAIRSHVTGLPRQAPRAEGLPRDGNGCGGCVRAAED